MLLSIIIVNWNVCALLKDCLLSIRRECLLSLDQYEVIVVDNASEDDSVSMLQSEFPSVKLIVSEDNLGFAAGCNKGFEVSQGKYIFLLNPDTIVKEHAVDDMLVTLDVMADVGILGCKLLNEDGSFQRASGGAFPSIKNVAWNYLFLNKMLPRRFAPLPLFLEEDPGGIVSIDWVSGAAMLLRREALEAKIFDESFFMFGEDMDLCDRVFKNGWKVCYTGVQSIIHYHGRSFEKQSSVEILSTAHKGPRKYFEKGHGRFSLAVYDLVLLFGYFVRWPAYKILALMKNDPSYDAMSVFSRKYVMSMLRLFFGKF